MFAGMYRFFECAGNGNTVDVTVSDGLDDKAAAADLEAACCRCATALNELVRFVASLDDSVGVLTVTLLCGVTTSFRTACDCLIFLSSTSFVSSLRSSSRSLRSPRSRSQISAADSSCGRKVYIIYFKCYYIFKILPSLALTEVVRRLSPSRRIRLPGDRHSFWSEATQCPVPPRMTWAQCVVAKSVALQVHDL